MSENIIDCPHAQVGSWHDDCSFAGECPYQASAAWGVTCGKPADAVIALEGVNMIKVVEV